jgi:ABC-2 type transport system ATP-binding protein
MLKAINLTKSFKNKIALSGLSLEVLPGELVCLLGREGSGKTTAIDLFLGLKSPSSGVANVDGVSAARAMARTRAALAYVPNEFALYPELTAKENLDFLVGASELDPLTDRQVADLLVEFGLDPAVLKTPAGQLNSNQKQRLGLAIGVARDAKAFLLDDPTVKLNDNDALDLGQIIRRLSTGDVGGQPAAVLMSTSNPDIAWGASRVALLEKGRIKAVLDGATLAGREMAERCLAHMQS